MTIEPLDDRPNDWGELMLRIPDWRHFGLVFESRTLGEMEGKPLSTLEQLQYAILMLGPLRLSAQLFADSQERAQQKKELADQKAEIKRLRAQWVEEGSPRPRIEPAQGPFEDLEDDPEVYTLHFPDDEEEPTDQQIADGIELVRRVLSAWQTLRPQILAKAFEQYKRIYEDEVKYGAQGDKDLVDPEAYPEPTDPSVIEDCMSLASFCLQEDPAQLGLSGHCTWDEEHGIGFIVEADKVIECGAADIV